MHVRVFTVHGCLRALNCQVGVCARVCFAAVVLEGGWLTHALDAERKGVFASLSSCTRHQRVT